MAEWVSAFDRWQGTKTKFQTLTGEKKPKPKGFLAQTFGHTGLTKALKAADESVAKLDVAQYMPEGEKRDKALTKALKDGDKVLKALQKECGGYAAFLKKAAVDEKDNEGGDKNLRYRAIKMLSAELDQIVANFDQTVSALKIYSDTSLSRDEQYAKAVKKGLAAALKSAALAIKKVMAEPTPANYNALFYTSNPPGRQINVQLAQAIRFGLPSGSVDPGTAKEKLMPWNAVNSAKSSIADNATRDEVLRRVKEFGDAVKFAKRYGDELP